MTWNASGWFGPAGTGRGADAVVVPSPVGKAPDERVLDALEAGMPNTPIWPAVAQDEEGIVVVTVGSRWLEGSRYQQRSTMNIVLQARSASWTESRKLFDRAIAVIQAASNVHLVEINEANGDFDEDAGSNGVYRHFGTLEIR